MAGKSLINHLRCVANIEYSSDFFSNLEDKQIIADSNLNFQKLKLFEEDISQELFERLLNWFKSEADFRGKQNLLDLFALNHITWLLKQNKFSHVSLVKTLEDISNKNFIKRVESNFVNSYATQVLSVNKDLDVFEDFAKCVEIIKNSQARDELATVIYIEISDHLDERIKDAKIIARKLKALPVTTKMNYEITEIFIDRFLTLLTYNDQFSNSPVILDELYVELTEEEVISTIFELINFPFKGRHESIFSSFKSKFQEELKKLESVHPSSNPTEAKGGLSSFYDNLTIPSIKELHPEEICSQLPIKNVYDLNFDRIKKIYSSPKNRIFVIACNYKQERVAVKFFDQSKGGQNVTSLQNQALYMYAMGKYPNFVQVYGAFMSRIPEQVKKQLEYNSNDPHGCLVMEYCYKSLQDFISKDLKSSKSINEKTRQQMTLECGLDLIDAMARLNSKGIKHKDIKPANILISNKDNKVILKIADFDVSTKAELEQERTVVRETGVVGTESYASPELFDLLKPKSKNSTTCQSESSKKKIEFNPNRSDVFSLGLTLLEMASLNDIRSLNDVETAGSAINLENKIKRRIDNEIENEQLKVLLNLMLKIDPRVRPPFRELEKECARNTVNVSKAHRSRGEDVS